MRLRSLLPLSILSLLLAVLAHAAESAAIHPSTQLIVVQTSDWNTIEGTLQRYERSASGKNWHAVGKAITIVVGKTGLAWGKGIVSADDLRNPAANDPIKKEGDGKAPAGIFRLSHLFGYAAHEPAGWKMPYINLTSSVECVDDTSSKFYNRVVDRTTVSPDWNSSEHMLRSDDLYRWGVVVDHNADPPRPGAGSCIFLHIWRGPGQPTVGCTAMPQENLESVLGWLDPAKKPLLVQLPQSEYQRLKKKWKLP
jgi:D-alanyl-D-alanine dipeptidase